MLLHNDRENLKLLEVKKIKVRIEGRSKNVTEVNPIHT